MSTSEAHAAASCPTCGKKFKVRPDQFGKRAKCRGCGESFEIEPDIDLVELPPSPPTVRRATAASSVAASKKRVAVPVNFGGVGAFAKKYVAPALMTIFIGLLLVGKGYKLWRKIEGDAGTKSTANANASRAGSSANSSTSAPAPKPTPHLVFTADAAGHQVGNVRAAMRSAGTDVRLVLPSGEHAAHTVPCVFICPAGSNLLTGVPFGDDEREDFYALLDRGIAVCFYSLDGTIKDMSTASDLQFAVAARAYLKSGGGLANVQDAIDTVLASSPAIDPARLGAAGHSSAGTVALTGAAGDPRIVAVAAMAPAIDLPKRLEPVMSQLDGQSTAAIHKMSPSSFDRLTADVFIYHPSDDDNVPASDSSAFAAKHGSRVTLKLAPKGGHSGAYNRGRPLAFDYLAEKFGMTSTSRVGKS